MYIVDATDGHAGNSGFGRWLTEEIDHEAYATSLREIGLPDFGGVVDEMLRPMPKGLLGVREDAADEPLERFFEGQLDSIISPMEDTLFEGKVRIRHALMNYVCTHREACRDLLPEIRYWLGEFEES